MRVILARVVAAVSLGCALANVAPASAEEAPLPAESVKAAFLYHFGSYVEWPEGQAEPPATTIGVIGDDPVVAELEQLLPRRVLRNRPVKVRALKSADDIANVQILFIGQAAARPDELIKAAQQRSILIITDRPDGLEHGGMINFVMADRRVRFEISRPAAEKSGLKFSSRLLAVAMRVKSSLLFNLNPGAIASS